MAGIQDFQEYVDDFAGTSVTFPEAANIGTPWLVDRVGAAPPTHMRNGGEAILSLEATSQIQVLGLHHGDALTFDIDDIQRVEMRVKLNGAFTTGSILTFGVGSARNDTADSVAANAWFRMEGASSTTAVYVETDDAVRDNDDVATGQTLATAYKRFLIDFTGGKANVRFYIEGIRVAAATTFDMSGYSAGLQPIIQLQKAANTNANVATIDYVKIVSRRS